MYHSEDAFYELDSQVAILETENERLHTENARLREEVAALTVDKAYLHDAMKYWSWDEIQEYRRGAAMVRDGNPNAGKF